MNDTTQKIAAEAAKDFCENHGLREHFIEKDLTRAIQSAIKKTYNTGLAQGYEKRAAKERELRAAHASGYRGDKFKPSWKRAHASEPQFNLETLEGRKAAWAWLQELFGNPLVVTKDGVPFEDQAEGIRQFKDASRAAHASENMAPTNQVCPKCGNVGCLTHAHASEQDEEQQEGHPQEYGDSN